jgi:hypothetical protein
MTHAASEGLADERGAVVTEGVQHVAENVGCGTEGVLAAGPGGRTVPEQVGATIVKRSASAGMTRLHVAELPAMPWTSSTTGPSPAVRHATRWPLIVRDCRRKGASVGAMLVGRPTA